MSRVSVEANAYINHLMTCRSCYAPCRRFCAVGLGLNLASDAAYIAGLADIGDRRYWRESQRKKHPEHMERLDELIKQKFEELRVGRDMASKAT